MDRGPLCPGLHAYLIRGLSKFPFYTRRPQRDPGRSYLGRYLAHRRVTTRLLQQYANTLEPMVITDLSLLVATIRYRAVRAAPLTPSQREYFTDSGFENAQKRAR